MRLVDIEPYKGCRIVVNREDCGVNVDELPTVDAVPVVRCKDCEHYKLSDAAGGKYCEILRYESPIETGYCCYGERKG